MARFLIVDDDITCRELLSILLSPYAQCDMAYNGREAVGAYRMALDSGNPYDLICLDIMMPEMDGHSTLRAIREIEKERHILGSDGVPVLMLTASEDPKDCIKAFTEGCECYVPKPIQEKSLMVEVHRLAPKVFQNTPALGQQSGQASNDSSDNNRIHCLIVDDDRVCRELLRDMLEPVADCDFAYDGSEAVDVVRLALEDRSPYDLICLDIMMPGMDGHEALAAIRELEAQSGIRCADGVKVIMTTALRDSKHCIQSFREGCECYVTKPVNQDEFFGKLQTLNLLGEEAGTSA